MPAGGLLVLVVAVGEERAVEGAEPCCQWRKNAYFMIEYAVSVITI